MLHLVKTVWPLFLALALLMIGNGLQGSLLGLRAGLEGFSATTTGLVMSAYYAGFLASSLLTPGLVRSVGHIRVFAAFASIASSMVLLHALYGNPLLWITLRFLTGFALAGLYVVAESWLNDIASNETRGRLLSLYVMNMYACLALGQYTLAFADPAVSAPFIFVSILVSLSLVPISLAARPQPLVEQVDAMSILELYRQSPLGVVACLLVGVAQGAFMGMGAVYGDLIDLSTNQIALLLSLPLIAVVATQLPIGTLSDRFDRRTVIAGVSAVVAACGAMAAFFGPEHLIILTILFTAYGALSVPLYSLAVAHVNDVLPVSKMLAASAGMVFTFGVGSVIGPFVAGTAMQLLAPAAFFAIGAAIHAGLAVFALYRMRQRPAPPREERTDFVPLGVRATSIAAVAAIDNAAEQNAPS